MSSGILRVERSVDRINLYLSVRRHKVLIYLLGHFLFCVNEYPRRISAETRQKISSKNLTQLHLGVLVVRFRSILRQNVIRSKTKITRGSVRLK
jgi:hypothetical protein